MRRLAVAVWLVPLSLVVSSSACSSAEDPLPAGLDNATVDGGEELDGRTASTSDAHAAGDGASTDGKASDAAPRMEYSGQATYYDADGTGACGFKATPNDLLVAALNGTQYVKKTWCGQCVEVTGPNGTVKVRIVDLCPGCGNGGLDLSETAFAKIAPLSAGRVKITWHTVGC